MFFLGGVFPDGSSLYRAFLIREFSNENLEFWLAVEDYKHLKPQKMATKAQRIYNDFVAVQASKEVRAFTPSFSIEKSIRIIDLLYKLTAFFFCVADWQINLDAETRLVTLANVQSNNPDAHAFDRAQRRIQHMMERDSYVRFLQSTLFLELVHTEHCPTSAGYVSDN